MYENSSFWLGKVSPFLFLAFRTVTGHWRRSYGQIDLCHNGGNKVMLFKNVVICP